MMVLLLVCTGAMAGEIIVGPQAMPDSIAPVSAPFDMAELRRPVFPQRSMTVEMAHTGLSTRAIQQAIDKMAQQGGGMVVIPSGQWLTGRIILRSNINLQLAKGCRLQFSGKIADYQPAVFTRDEGIEISFRYAASTGLITGTGKTRLMRCWAPRGCLAASGATRHVISTIGRMRACCWPLTR